MRDYVLVTDSDTEIPYSFAKEQGLGVFFMPFTLNGKEELYDLGEKCDEEAFFEALRNGGTAATSTRSPEDIAEFFRSYAKQDKDVLYLCFSSQLSSHYELSLLARDTVMAEFPGVNIEVVDTLRISMGAGILVMRATQMWKNGESLEAVRDWVLANRNRANAWFMADDLSYLKRGGRLSGTAALVGTLLSIKPMLVLSKEGRVINVDKVNGKKKAFSYLVNKIKENIEDGPSQTVTVLHGGVLADGNALADEIRAQVDVGGVEVKLIGPVIGAHCGPNVLAVIFMGKEVTV